jgi:hypothetical protein
LALQIKELVAETKPRSARVFARSLGLLLLRQSAKPRRTCAQH